MINIKSFNLGVNSFKKVEPVVHKFFLTECWISVQERFEVFPRPKQIQAVGLCNPREIEVTRFALV